MTLISLAIINFNRSRFLEVAIRSCLNQSIDSADVEVIVVDDGSTDGSLEIVRKFKDVRLVASETNRGVGHASSLALEASRGDYFMRVDSDDYLGRDALRLLAPKLMNDDRISYAFGDLRRIDLRTEAKSTISMARKSVLFMNGAGVLFRAHDLRRVGGYDRSLRNCEDLDMFLRLEEAGAVGAHVPIPLYRYLLHGSNTSEATNRRKICQEIAERHPSVFYRVFGVVNTRDWNAVGD